LRLCQTLALLGALLLGVLGILLWVRVAGSAPPARFGRRRPQPHRSRLATARRCCSPDVARSGPARAYGTLRAAEWAAPFIESAGPKPPIQIPTTR
jgi:hypothetical protein